MQEQLGGKFYSSKQQREEGEVTSEGGDDVVPKRIRWLKRCLIRVPKWVCIYRPFGTFGCVKGLYFVSK